MLLTGLLTPLISSLGFAPIGCEELNSFPFFNATYIHTIGFRHCLTGQRFLP